MKRFSTLLLAVLFVATGAGISMADTIKIGLMAPLTGSWASEGEEMKNIVNLLADEINANGGLLGQQIEVIAEDDGGDPRTASLAAQRLATQEVIAVIGTYGSSVTEASQAIYDDFSILQVANGSTAIRLTEKGLKYFFRTSPRDDEQGRVAAQTIKGLGFGKVAILHDNTSYAKGLAEETKGLLEKTSNSIVFFDALTPGERDYTAILTKMKAANPDVVFFTGYYPELGLILRQKMEMAWNVPFIGGDATNNPDLVKIAGAKAAEGYYFLSPPVPQDLAFAKSKDFLKAYKAKYGSYPGSIWAVLSGDGFLTITEGVKAAKTTDPEKLAEFLHAGTQKVSGLTGKIAFNTKGDRVGEVYRVYRIDAEGKFILQDK
ncbi:MAG: branched-chain amino acid ABC transporter substrate-binding protein [Deltaproteobacteria bacterium]|nr:branched-chain amino acid ABC transporter substrate-binding protein [Deltaproteobacteria bacterium]